MEEANPDVEFITEWPMDQDVTSSASRRHRPESDNFSQFKQKRSAECTLIENASKWRKSDADHCTSDRHASSPHPATTCNSCANNTYIQSAPATSDLEHRSDCQTRSECNVLGSRLSGNAVRSGNVTTLGAAWRNDRDENVSDECEMPAAIALSRWWKRTGRHLVDKNHLPASKNPKTFLHHLARLPEGREFLQTKRRELQGKLDQGRTGASLYTAIATMEDFLQQPESAAKFFSLASQVSPDNTAYKFMLEKVTRQVGALEQQRKMAERLEQPASNLCFPAPRQVTRRLAEELSFAEFCDFARRREPVVILGLASHVTSMPWTLQHIAQVAGHCQATVKRLVPDSTEWARLENSQHTTVAQFISNLMARERDSKSHPDVSSAGHSLDGKDSSVVSEAAKAKTAEGSDKGTGREGIRACRTEEKDKQEIGTATHASASQLDYLFDWSIPLYCPELAQELVIPKYFAGDYLQRTSPGSLYRDSWPSLFVAPAGALSELHVDTFASNFWMALFQGKKRWLFFSKDDLPLLYPEYLDSLDPIFRVDLSTADLKTFPLLSLTTPMECVLEPGDVLFVPSGCPHRVETLETSVAISANYVDATNVEAVIEELRVMGLVEPQAASLLQQLESSNLPRTMPESASDLPWQEFKQSQGDMEEAVQW